MAYEFPATPATPANLRALERLVIRYIRDEAALHYRDLPAAIVGQALGLREAQAKVVVGEARSSGMPPIVRLTIDLLHGMHTGKLPALAEAPKNATTRWLYEQVHYLDRREWWAHAKTNDNVNTMRMWHAAFQLDYREWLRRR